MVIFGIFIYPGATGSVAQSGVGTKPVEVDVIARGLTVLNPEDFLGQPSPQASLLKLLCATSPTVAPLR